MDSGIEKARRSDVIRYVRWRDSLPDLSGLPENRAWLEFVKAHDNRCSICRKEDNEKVVDHDHTTGLIRGLLCRSCNKRAMSGVLHRPYRSYYDVSWSIILYCQNPPARVAGIWERYNSPFGEDPAPELANVIWSAGPDGLAHDWLERLIDQDAALTAALVAELPIGEVVEKLRA